MFGQDSNTYSVVVAEYNLPNDNIDTAALYFSDWASNFSYHLRDLTQRVVVRITKMISGKAEIQIFYVSIVGDQKLVGIVVIEENSNSLRHTLFGFRPRVSTVYDLSIPIVSHGATPLAEEIPIINMLGAFFREHHKSLSRPKHSESDVTPTESVVGLPSHIVSRPENDAERRNWQRVFDLKTKEARSYEFIAQDVGISPATVYRWLKEMGLIGKHEGTMRK